MNEIQVFNSKEFGATRAITIDGEPWFVGREIATILGYGDGNPDSKAIPNAVADHVDVEDKRRITAKDLQGFVNSDLEIKSNYGIIIINESGLYSLIFGSHLESAKRFKHWVTKEVLPALRKTGTYTMNQPSYQIENPAERARVWAKEYEEREALAQKVEEQKPKAEYFDSLVDSKLYTTFRDTAKELHVPPRQFTQWLVDNGYLYRDKHKMLKPYESFRKSGLFVMKDFLTPAGYSNVQTYVTVKGKETFRLLLTMRDNLCLEDNQRQGRRDNGC